MFSLEYFENTDDTDDTVDIDDPKSPNTIAEVFNQIRASSNISEQIAGLKTVLNLLQTTKKARKHLAEHTNDRDLVTHLMRTHYYDADIQSVGCRILSCIPKISGSGETVECIEVILAALFNFSAIEQEIVGERALVALWHFARVKYRGYQDRIKNNHGIPLILDIMNKYPENYSIQSAGVLLMNCLLDNNQEIQQEF